MSDIPSFKIECPSCGQRYSLELGDDGVSLTCPKCAAQFSASREQAIDTPHPANATDSDASKSTYNQTIPMSHSISQEKKSILDKFIAQMFRFGKSFSGVLAVIFLIGILLSMLVFVFHLRSPIEVPTYSQIAASSADENGNEAVSDSGDLDDRRRVEKNFGDDLASLVKEYSLGQSMYDELLVLIRGIENDYRKDFVAGLEDALSDAADARKNKDSKSAISPNEVVEKYSEAFKEAEQMVLTSKAANSITRWSALGSVLLCCFMLFMMLVIPALLKIEENTRKPVA